MHRECLILHLTSFPRFLCSVFDPSTSPCVCCCLISLVDSFFRPVFFLGLLLVIGIGYYLFVLRDTVLQPIIINKRPLNNREILLSFITVSFLVCLIFGGFTPIWAVFYALICKKNISSIHSYTYCLSLCYQAHSFIIISSSYLLTFAYDSALQTCVNLN